METVGIVGTGIAGMACARKIHRDVDLTLFEAELEPGGHTHTVDIREGSKEVPVDTGFMVYNQKTYPLLTGLFRELDVETCPTNMSFGVQFTPDNVEYCGSSLKQLFAQPLNTIRPRFLGMLRDVLRFNRLAVGCLADPDVLGMSLKEFADKNRFGRPFLDYYLVPMTSAIWSTPPDAMLDFPAHTLIRFMYNHGLLGVRTHHQWRTVKNGSRSYRDKLIAPFKDRIRSGCAVRSVRKTGKGVQVRDATGESHTFDKVVFATHADTTLRLLENPDLREERLLACFPYAANSITLHSDPSVMPRRKGAWASWNYRIDAVEGGAHQASTHYWMNSLQRLDTDTPYFVSVNDPGLIREDSILQRFTFDHPMFDKAAVEAQLELPLLNENGKVYFCGSYFRYGFHEDGLMSGYAAADRLLSHIDAHAELVV
ncbi:MAG: NAD(P)/FAD-dependent oxidoreductase [Oceanipulchritudo sp.]